MSRPTNLNLRNPDEHTPAGASYTYNTTYYGTNLEYGTSRHKSLKGNMSRDMRFP